MPVGLDEIATGRASAGAGPPRGGVALFRSRADGDRRTWPPPMPDGDRRCSRCDVRAKRSLASTRRSGPAPIQSPSRKGAGSARCCSARMRRRGSSATRPWHGAGRLISIARISRFIFAMSGMDRRLTAATCSRAAITASAIRSGSCATCRYCDAGPRRSRCRRCRRCTGCCVGRRGSTVSCRSAMGCQIRLMESTSRSWSCHTRSGRRSIRFRRTCRISSDPDRRAAAARRLPGRDLSETAANEASCRVTTAHHGRDDRDNRKNASSFGVPAER